MHLEWIVVAAGLAAIALWRLAARFMAGGSRQRTEDEDPGEAILAFGRAHPEEAIRQAIPTASGEAVFFRLADGKTGFFQAYGHHGLTTILVPEALSVEAGADPHVLSIRFRDGDLRSGTFRFVSPQEAAEVSLWLCGAFLARSRDLGHEGRDVSASGGGHGSPLHGSPLHGIGSGFDPA